MSWEAGELILPIAAVLNSLIEPHRGSSFQCYPWQ